MDLNSGGKKHSDRPLLFFWWCVALGGVLAVSVGCTTPSLRTKRGAMIGSAVGGSVGALLGAPAGSVAGGILLGSLTGAAIGGGGGNYLDLKAKELERKGSIIKDQEKILKDQEEELNRLRNLTKDAIAFNGDKKGQGDPLSSTYVSRGVQESSIALKKGQKARAGLSEKELFSAGIERGDEQSAFKKEPNEGHTTSFPLLSAKFYDKAPIKRGSMEAAAETEVLKCPPKAKELIAKGEKSSLASDKMFYFKKALRICPLSSKAHYLLGEVYITLNRQRLAEREFKEALKIDPANTEARKKLRNILALNAPVTVF